MPGGQCQELRNMCPIQRNMHITCECFHLVTSCKFRKMKIYCTTNPNILYCDPYYKYKYFNFLVFIFLLLFLCCISTDSRFYYNIRTEYRCLVLGEQRKIKQHKHIFPGIIWYLDESSDPQTV